MIATCRSCHQAFWRYRRDHPPSGFCSLSCHAAGPTKPKRDDVLPPKPDVVLANMVRHRLYFHFTTSLLGWYADCATCEELETDYAASLEYHWETASKELVADANYRWAQQTSSKANA